MHWPLSSSAYNPIAFMSTLRSVIAIFC